MEQETAISHGYGAVAFILADENLRERFLALTGLSPDDLRQNIKNEPFLASVLDFLMNHEPDLIAFAEASETTPSAIVEAWRKLGGGIGQEW